MTGRGAHSHGNPTAMLAMLTCAMGIGPLINLALSSISAVVIDDLGITAGQYGWISTVCFTVAAIGSMYAGRLSDRISDRAQMVIIFGGSALAFGLAAMTSSFFWLLGAIIVSGLSQAMANPTTNRLTGLHAPAGKQAGWIGLKQSGQQAAQFAAGALFPSLSLAFGWRGAAALCGLLAALLLIWALLQVGPRQAAFHAAASALSDSAAKQPLSPRVLFFAAQACIASIGLTATNVYLPLFGVRELDFPVVLGGVVVSVIGIVGVTSRILWARSMTAGRGTNNLLVVLGAGAVVGSLALVAAGISGEPAFLWIGAVLHGMMALGINVVVMAGVMRVVTTASVGRATGTVSLGLFAGIALGPLVMGSVLDATQSFTIGWIVVAGFNLLGLLLAGGLRVRSGA